MFPNNSGKTDKEPNEIDFVPETEASADRPLSASAFSALCHATALLCFCVMALMLAARLLSGGFLRSLSEKIGAVPLLISVNVLAFFIPTLIFFLVYRQKDRSVLASVKSKGNLRYIVSSLFLLIVCAMFTQSLRCYLFGAPSDAGMRFSDSGTVPILFCYAVLPAILEESLFRGVILRFYTHRCGGLCAVLASAVLFSLSHFSPEDFLSYFISGLILGFTAYVTGSLWAVTVMHLVNNVFSLYLENAVFKIATESKSIVLMLFLLAALALLILFWTLFELEALCRAKFLSAPKRTAEEMQTPSSEDMPDDRSFPRLIPFGTPFGQALRRAVFSPFFIGCVVIFLLYTQLLA